MAPQTNCQISIWLVRRSVAMVPVLFSWIPRRSALATVRAAAVLLVWMVLWLSAMFVVLLVGRKVLAPRLFVPEVEITAVSLVSPAQAQQLLVATGYVVPQRQANISPRIGGRVAKLFVEDGTVVKKGQLIAVLEDQDYRAQVLQTEADVHSSQAREKRAEVDLRDAQRAWDREKVGQEKGASTPADREQATARLEGGKAALAAARSDTAAARARG